MPNEEEKKVTKQEKKAKLVEAPTQYGVFIQLPDGRNLSELELLVEIYNDLQEVKKSI